MERFQKSFSHRGKRYRATFLRRPFREGLEVRLDLDGEIISMGELGLGEKALIERLKTELDKRLSRKS